MKESAIDINRKLCDVGLELEKAWKKSEPFLWFSGQIIDYSKARYDELVLHLETCEHCQKLQENNEVE